VTCRGLDVRGKHCLHLHHLVEGFLDVIFAEIDLPGSMRSAYRNRVESLARGDQPYLRRIAASRHRRCDNARSELLQSLLDSGGGFRHGDSS
jgi:hypothetical protein